MFGIKVINNTGFYYLYQHHFEESGLDLCEIHNCDIFVGFCSDVLSERLLSERLYSVNLKVDFTLEQSNEQKLITTQLPS